MSKNFIALSKRMILILFDAVLIEFLFIFSFYIRHHPFFYNLQFKPFNVYLKISPVIVFISILSLLVSGAYSKIRGAFSINHFLKITKGIFISVIISISITFVYREFVYSRLVLIIFFILSVIFVSLNHIIIRKIFSLIYLKGIDNINIVIIGEDNKRVSRIINRINFFSKYYGFKFLGLININNTTNNNSIYLGNIEELESLIKKYNINEIIVTDFDKTKIYLKNLLLSGIENGITIKILPDFLTSLSSQLVIDEIIGLPIIELSKLRLRYEFIVLKRLLDIFISILALILFLPIFIIIPIIIKLESKGPIIFKQKRVGKNGKLFNMYKFRTMVENAEFMKKNLINQNEKNEVIFKIKNDPRITKVGRFLRKYSLDELPQIFNVLKGEMSIVGPRPPLQEEVEKYNKYEFNRLSIKPGMTGLWQVSGRSDLDFQDMIYYDLYYIENYHLMLDLEIILKTIKVVIKGEGAY